MTREEVASTLTRRTVIGLALSVLVIVAGCIVTPLSAASAEPASIVCQGYVGCNRGVFTTHDYQAHVKSSYWNMYAGDNCTNYVAYVETAVFGVATPTYHLGDAGQWPTSTALHGALVDHTPTVGAVAEWDGGSPGIPSPGHVAVVEEVGPRNSFIVISQQNVTDVNDYDWTRINSNGVGNLWEQWPSNFIHFPSGPAPRVSGPHPSVAWIVVKVSPARFQNDRLVFSNGVPQLVTPGSMTTLAAGSRAGTYDIAFRDHSLQKRYVLLVSARGPNLRVLHQGGPSTRTVPRIGVIGARGAHGHAVLSITVRPGGPDPTPSVAASTPAVTTDSSTASSTPSTTTTSSTSSTSSTFP